MTQFKCNLYHVIDHLYRFINTTGMGWDYGNKEVNTESNLHSPSKSK